MEGLVGLVFLVGVWFLVAPILGVIGFFRSQRLDKENRALRSELARLSAAQGASDAPVGSVETGPSPSSDALPSDPASVPLTAETPRPEQTEQVVPTDHTATEPVPTPEPFVQPPPEPTEEPETAAPPPSTNPEPKPKVDWERKIAANWIVWIGGAALALGGLFLVRMAIDAGFFGPTVRTLCAVILGGGLIQAAFHFDRKRQHGQALKDLSNLPAILIGAGVISLYGACLAAGALYQLVPPLVALILFALVSSGAVLLSLRYGPVIAGMGLAGAYAAPLFTGASGGSPIILLPYMAAITAAGLALVQLRQWTFLTWLSLVGAVIWGVISLQTAGSLADWAVPSYALGLIAIATFFAAEAARDPLALSGEISRILTELPRRSEALFACVLFWVGGGSLIFLTAVDGSIGPFILSVLVLYGGLGLLMAWQREGLSYVAPISAAIIASVLVIWTGERHGGIETTMAFAIGIAALGTVLFTRVKVQTPLALTGALALPVGLFILFWRGEDFQTSPLWGGGAFLAALLLLFVLEQIKEKDFDFLSHPGAGAAYALGTVLCIGLAPFMVFEGLWLGTAVAVVALAIGFIQARFPIPLIGFLGSVCAAASVFLLMRPGALSPSQVSPTYFFNEISLGFGVAIVALALSGRLFIQDPRYRRAYEGAASILAFALVGLLIRHTAGGGSLDGAGGGLAEMSGYAIAYLGAATSLAWRYPGGSWFVRGWGYIAALIGSEEVLIAFTALDWDPALGAPLLNLLFVAFAMPAMLLGAYGYALNRSARAPFGRLISIAAMILGFAWITLETRRLLAGADLSLEGVYRQGEMGAYSVAWILYAFGLLIWGVWRRQALARYASLGVLAVTLVKVFLFDLSALDGVLRAASFIGLGISLIGVALFYQRFVFKGEGSDPAMLREGEE